MFPHHYLIGGVALVIGTLAIAAAVTNHDSFFRLAKLRMLENAMGRSGARWACGLIGCALILLGGFIVAGVLPRRMSDASRTAADNEFALACR